eukprot:3071-Pelagococcus_subviridis.AAC.3
MRPRTVLLVVLPLPLVRVAVRPRHHAAPRALPVDPLAVVDVRAEAVETPPVRLFPLPVSLPLEPLALVSLALRVEKDSESVLLVLHPRAVVLDAVAALVEPPVRPEPGPSVVRPLALVDVAVGEGVGSFSVLSVFRPLPFVLGASGEEDRRALAVLVRGVERFGRAVDVAVRVRHAAGRRRVVLDAHLSIFSAED